MSLKRKARTAREEPGAQDLPELPELRCSPRSISDVGGETPATITEDHGEEKHTIDNQNASQEAKDRANARK